MGPPLGQQYRHHPQAAAFTTGTARDVALCHALHEMLGGFPGEEVGGG